MIIKRPLIWFLLTYLCGMALYKLEPFHIYIFLILICIGIVVLLYQLINIKKYKLMSFSFLFFIPILFVSGYLIMQQASQAHQMDLYFDDKIEARVIGKVKKIENKENYQLLILEDSLIYIDPNTNIIHSKDNTLHIKNNTLPYSKDNNTFHSKGLKIFNKSHINLKIGNTVAINGEIIKFQKATNPGQFDEYSYNKTQKLDYKVYCDSAEIICKEYSIYKNFLYNLKSRIFTVYDSVLPEKVSGVLSAMILGDKASLDPDIKELYQTHGISHILAISGLHVSLIGMALYKTLRKTGLNIPLTVILSIVLIYSYGVLTNFGVSTIRAVIMLITMLISKVLGRTYDLLSATCLSGLIILISNPLQVFSVGFLLSFGAIVGIGLIYPVLSNSFQINNKILSGLIDTILISLSVQITTLPILLYFFYEISTYSLIFNIVLVPFVSIIIGLAIIGGIIGLFYKPLALFFLGGTYYILNFYEWILNIADKFPMHTLVLGMPSITIIITYYFLISIFILLNYWKKRKYSWLLLTLLLVLFLPNYNNGLKITLLDVGQGDGIYMESKSGTSYLIDGGSTTVKEVGKYRIVPFLKSKGIKKLNYVFISHFDEDHINGILEIMEDMTVVENSGKISIETLVLPKYSYKLEEDEMYLKCINLAQRKGIKLVYMEEGNYIKDEYLIIRCLNPVKDNLYFSQNASSMVLDINYKEFDLLLTGDVEAEGENSLINILIKENKQIKGYDVLKISHHGSKNSTCKEFLDIVRPRYSLISSGKNNSYGHPHNELIGRIRYINSEIYSTIEEGAIYIQTDGQLMKIESFIK